MARSQEVIVDTTLIHALNRRIECRYSSYGTVYGLSAPPPLHHTITITLVLYQADSHEVTIRHRYGLARCSHDALASLQISVHGFEGRTSPQFITFKVAGNSSYSCTKEDSSTKYTGT
ncbi:hypothetical protein L1987_05170 [Smallanthus sonchifolius]|uniref:Uncharacterized protein n=1 Tax=Smallanthus sonchifolius TaxID=185202 RepID=A0ACB9JUS7_9ASTR|nr:hypothetical protein L1987_05170 [Smallanthus sonchifolius]